MSRYTKFLGPWPFQPLVVGSIMFAVAATYAAGVFTYEALFRSATILLVIGPALGVGASAFVVLYIGKRWQQRRGVHWPAYLLTLACAAVPIALIRFVLGFAPETQGADPLTPFVAVLRVFLALFLVMVGVGSVTNRLQRERMLTEEALALAQRQQIQIIAADEEARRQASTLLHDRVQAGLLSSCLELQQFKRELEPGRVDELQPIIDRLETLRSLDVRSAARALSPNLEDVDLQTAIEDLAMQYETHLVVHVRVSPEIDRDRAQVGKQVLLGAYRIVEQGLLNAAVHANATQVDVAISRSADETSIAVTDNGSGMDAHAKTGTGAALIETWTRSLQGSWRWEKGPHGEGTALLAVLRQPPTSDRVGP